MSRVFNSTAIGFCFVLFLAGAQKQPPKVNQLPQSRSIKMHNVPIVVTFEPEAAAVRTADWSPIKLPNTVQNVAYNAGGCANGSCSILGLARREASGEASGPVRRVFSGFAERRPVRRLLGRLRCR